ncbi:hypothetical protein [Shimia sp. R9_2]|uniref:hypothetical protein n=1 Tax=Shimia sp. R9_2 TaxID=2821112 RepID=UPI001ADD10B6|nr:hypothetical protein [Shimia sp. R9_2]
MIVSWDKPKNGIAMATDRKQLRLCAHRAIFSEETKITFQDILEQLKQNLPKHSDRLLEPLNSTDTSVAISKFFSHPSNLGTGVLLSTFVVGRQVSTMSFQNSEEEIEIGTQTAEEGEEFLDKNIALFAVGDVVISCGLGKRTTTVCTSLYRLAKNAQIIPNTTSFNLTNMPHGDTLKAIKSVGVKRVEMDATALIGSLPRSFKGGLIEQLFGTGDSGEAIKKRRENVAKIAVFSSRMFKRSGFGVLEQDKNIWLDSIAKEVVEDKNIDAYTIILNNDVPIKSGSLLWQKLVSLPADGTSYDVQEAHKKMIAFYQELGGEP